MRAMVIGGTGFIGSNLCEALISNGDSVACVDNMSLGNENNIASILGHPNFSIFKTDATNIDDLMDVFNQVKPDYVFHLAANSDIQASANNPAIEYLNTYTSTFNILSCMKMYNIKRLFFASTSAVYGDKRGTVLNENTPCLAPISYYGAAKLGSEAMISAFTYMNDFSALIFRFPNVIGPHLTHGVIYDFVKRLRCNPHELVILGDGKQTKPYIYVKDLIEAILMLRNAQSGVTIYNLGVEGVTQVTHIAEIIVEEMGLKGVNFRYTGGEAGWKGDVPTFQYDLTKIHSAGWSAKLNSDEAVRQTVREYLHSSLR